MDEVELTVIVTMDRIYDILSDLNDADTVRLIKRLIPDLSESCIDDLETFIENL